MKNFFCFDIPPGGVAFLDNRKRIVNRKEKIANTPVSHGEEFSKELLCVVRINCF